MAWRSLPPVAAIRLGVFTAAEACAAGWTPEALEHAVRTGRLLRLRRGVFVTVDGDDLHPADRARRDRARRAIAAALVTSHAVVSGLAAATLRGWPVWAPRELACVTVTNSRSTSLIGDVHLHRGGLAADAWAETSGFRVTGPTRTVVDIAREFGTEAGLVVADAAVAAGATSSERLQQQVDRLVGRRGIPRARPLPDLVDGRAESPLESRSRWHCHAHELPPPEPQVVLLDLNGRFLGRVDLYWADGVVGEVDGADKLEDPRARAALLERQTGLMRAGLHVVRWGAPQLRNFGPTAAWLRTELAAAACDPRPRGWIAVPSRLGSETVAIAPVSTVSDPSRR